MDIWADKTFQTPVSNSTLLPLLLLSLANQKTTPHSAEWINSEYDFIIVGGGTAGSVVASRLSEVPCVTVLLLEAGPEPPILTEVPRLASSFSGTTVDWQFKSTPQKHAAFAHKQRTVSISAGKMLGGSSNINGMAYFRGNRKNYDDWAAKGAQGWSYDDVLPYFLKLEDNTNVEFLENGYHAAGGPITIENPRYVSELTKVIYEATSEMGYEFIDSNAERQTGFSDFQHNTRNGQRCSTAKAYLVPAENRPNLHILLNAMVTKVIIEKSQATGVVFHHKNQFLTVKARKEIIISAGTANTPKLLMLSGIGPASELKKWNIFLNADLPVGRNLQDHGGSKYFFTLPSQYSTSMMLSNYVTISDYIDYRLGPLSTAGTATIANLNDLNTPPSVDFPNYQLFISEVGKQSQNSTVFKAEVYKKLFEPIRDHLTVFACVTQLLQPRSTGTVTLRSLNSSDLPVIDPNYFEDPGDLADVVDGLKMCKKLMQSEAFQRIGAKPLPNLMPGCEIYAESDEKYFTCYVRKYIIAGHHMVGTAKMGNPSDPTTVVDPELRVKNIEGLRVVDASVMPIVPSANTQTPTVMVAEKASDIIKQSIICT